MKISSNTSLNMRRMRNKSCNVYLSPWQHQSPSQILCLQSQHPSQSLWLYQCLSQSLKLWQCPSQSLCPSLCLIQCPSQSSKFMLGSTGDPEPKPESKSLSKSMSGSTGDPEPKPVSLLMSKSMSGFTGDPQPKPGLLPEFLPEFWSKAKTRT